MKPVSRTRALGVRAVRCQTATVYLTPEWDCACEGRGLRKGIEDDGALGFGDLCRCCQRQVHHTKHTDPTLEIVLVDANPLPWRGRAA